MDGAFWPNTALKNAIESNYGNATWFLLRLRTTFWTHSFWYGALSFASLFLMLLDEKSGFPKFWFRMAFEYGIWISAGLSIFNVVFLVSGPILGSHKIGSFMAPYGQGV